MIERFDSDPDDNGTVRNPGIVCDVIQDLPDQAKLRQFSLVATRT